MKPGVVQVFTRAENQLDLNSTGVWDEERFNRYQLLNKVSAGGTLSSPFKILNLFTEHVRISWANDNSPPGWGNSPSSAYQSPHPSPRTRIPDRIGPFRNSPHSTSTVVASLLYPGPPAPAFEGNLLPPQIGRAHV